MTSTLKADIELTKTALTSDNDANKADVLEPIGDAETKLEEVRQTVSVSPTDTHYKHLADALEALAPLVMTILNPSADAKIQFGAGTKLTALEALLTAGGKVPVGGLDSTGALNSYVATADGSGGVSFAAAGGGGAQPVDIAGQAGEALAIREHVYLSTADHKWYKVDIDADPIEVGSMRGVTMAAISLDATGAIRVLGEVSGFAGLTAWGEVYASSTAGGHTQTRPLPSLGGAQVALVRIGLATSSTTILVNTLNAKVQYMKRMSRLNGELITIKHHTDTGARTRNLRAYLSGTAIGSSLTTYGSANQDSDVGLAKLVYTADQCTGGTAISSTGTAASAFDNNPAVLWAGTENTSGIAGVSYIGYNFGSTKHIRKINITSGNSSENMVGSVKVQYSDNGSSWTDVGTYSLSTQLGLTQAINLPATSAHQYWRLLAQSGTSTGGGWNVAEIEMMEGVAPNDKLAQSFQVTGAQTIEAVSLWLKKVGTISGNLTVRIETNNAGSPSGTLVDADATKTIAISQLGTGYGWVSFNFDVNFSVSGSTTYWIVLSTDQSTSDTDYIEWGADGSTPGYANGEMKSQASSAWNAESKDAVFEVFAEGTGFDSPLLGASWGSAVGEVEFVSGDGSGSNQDTQSTMKNTKGATIDATLVVEVE